jgi:uncharacterized membrane protein YgcG
MSAEGVRNQLGRPRLSLFEILAREAIQNSWDARLSTKEVLFRVDGRQVSDDLKSRLAVTLDHGLADEHLHELHEAFQRDALNLIVVSDRGTTGLGGPTRADVETDTDAPRDFVAFVRNLGEPRDKEFGAGTFGFGKTIFYLVSQARTIVVYTRCRVGGRYETRLIGCAIGESFGVREGGLTTLFTGRHWWGIHRDGVQEPLLDAEADEVASVFQLQPFGDDETGTSIVLIDPAFEDPHEDMRAIACAITWHAWPKMISEAEGMHFKVSWNGEEIEVPDPELTPPLDGFAAAYRRVSRGERLECYRPQQLLGKLCLHRQLVRAQQPEYPSSFEPPLQSPVHHVALLRAPHFVVKYHAGDPLAGDAAEYAGVFLAEEEIDDVFAQSEPPTHDDWVPQQLKGAARTFVKTTYTRLNDRLRAYARPITGEVVGTGGVPLGAASAQFATLVATAASSGGAVSGRGDVGGGKGGGSGGGEGAGGSDGKTRGPRGSVEEVGAPEYGSFGDEPAILFTFRVRRAGAGAVVRATASVGVDESLSTETESPIGSAQPQILGWIGPEGDVHHGETLPTDGRIGQLWRAAVEPAPDSVTAASLRIEGGTL